MKRLKWWVGVLAVVLAYTLVPSAQVAEFDFYPTFRAWMRETQAAGRLPAEALFERYRQKLASEGVAPAEIDRRTLLLRTKPDALEADFWNRFFTAPNPGFNTEPNGFLQTVVEKRTPGRALDVGMGEGRNTLYLAKLGWDVTGFDPAEQAVALAQQRAKTLGVKIRTVIALDRDFDFGREQWDLIVYSWVGPSQAPQVIDSLKPGGLIVFEGSSAWFPKDALREMFKPLAILHYSIDRAQSDFFKRQEMDVLRLAAQKKAVQ
jgi:SAM-dependent methyltransferase